MASNENQNVRNLKICLSCVYLCVSGNGIATMHHTNFWTDNKLIVAIFLSLFCGG